MIKEHLESTGLETVSECVQKEPFSTVGPKIGNDRLIGVTTPKLNFYLVRADLTQVFFIAFA